MNQRAPFTAQDLQELDDSILSRAQAVVAMEDVHDGHIDPRSVGFRHDVDAGHALQTAVKLAHWEATRGYRSTYYILHTAPYWDARGFYDALENIADLGHEIGIHTDALAEALRTGRDPDHILELAITHLRKLGFTIRGVAGHGNPLCNRNRAAGEITFANDEQFVECARPQEGEPDRTITRGNVTLKLRPRPLADFGLDYEALNLAYANGPFPFRFSDSGGVWLKPGWDDLVRRWQTQQRSAPHQAEPSNDVRQLHFLLHPDWWQMALAPQAVAA